MKVKQFTITRKFNTGNYETQDYSLTFEMEDDDKFEDLREQCFEVFRNTLKNSDLPEAIKEKI